MILWLDGRLVPAAEARIDPADRGFLLADGLFETIRAEDGRALRVRRHLARLRHGAELLGIPLPLDDLRLVEVLTTVLEANGLAAGAAALRVTLSRGPGPRGLLPPEATRPTLLVAATPLPPPRPPARARLAHSVRRNEGSPTSRLKTLAYVDNLLALREAVAGGGDEALLRNGQGRLACGSMANLFLFVDGRLVTPPPAEGALPGVTRGRLLELARDLGIEVVERPLPLALLGRAAEVFLSNSLVLVRPVAEIDGRALPTPCPGPVTARLAAALAADPG
jgi:branched-chain amino acid aminotransferase